MIILSDETADIPTPSGMMRMHVFRPAIAGRFPGIVLFSEIYQVTAPIRRLAAMMAGLGHVVCVPEVYHEYEPAGTVLAYDKPGTDRGNFLKHEKSLAAYDHDARAALDWLAAYPHCTGALATMGVCLGGHLAFRAALDPRVRATVCFYATDIHAHSLGHGKCDDTLARVGEMKGEAFLVWGRQDPHVPFAGRQMIREALEQAQVCYEWHEFNAQHAFLRDEGHRYDSALFLQCMDMARTFLGRIMHLSA
ncbi:dienelactone hydrolase family protein [Komagataeibacter intermedius]|uniref:Dienelactone hydrolase n=2 Tax=Komagataeibacter intermedius TaxID=66229 RepID=A0A0N1N4J3_9PROT|nr:dienelactone hydrolase family protein [Komagataeibacter intermedius]KPH88448.1 dienelactone hydrolase [Komagataeibacter intermedius AF2]MCF3635566.1 dienelactone hydrolase family protein [Komagataeibacter intermedius]GAN88719.1 carboxymethylenebutenolidase [Komagataeibacter intermedius TF2]GBQ78922.1 carboxymethylenebutenolidase [Komagataeibacter intermedius NRIC 0521]